MLNQQLHQTKSETNLVKNQRSKKSNESKKIGKTLSEETAKAQEVDKSIKQKRMQCIGALFQCDVAELMLKNNFEIRKNVTFNDVKADIKSLAETLKRIQRNQKHQNFGDEGNTLEKIDEQKYDQLISKLNLDEKNRSAISGDIDIIFSSKNNYTMCSVDKIDQVFIQKAAKNNSKIWFIKNWTQRMDITDEQKKNLPVRIIFEVKKDPLGQNYKDQNKKNEYRYKNFAQILKLLLCSKQLDQIQFMKKYEKSIPMNNSNRFQRQMVAYCAGKTYDYKRGYKPTILYYIIDKNTDKEKFQKDFGQFMVILKPWCFWLNVYVHVVCYNVDYISQNVHKQISELMKQEERKREDLEKKVQQEQRKREESEKKALEEREELKRQIQEEQRKREESEKKALEEREELRRQIQKLIEVMEQQKK